MVEAIVGIAKGMGKKTIAEFVADGETVRLLETCGVDNAQRATTSVGRGP